MRKLGRIFFIAICLFFLLSCTESFAPTAYAASNMTASETCIDFIKEIEGFAPHPYYDYTQHTVGYGTKCPTEKYFEYSVNGISKEEADTLLRKTVADIGDAIHTKLIARYNLTLTQHQFDALVSFSFNIGTGWMTYDSTLRNAILRNADEDELLYSFGLYCTAGGNYSSGLIARRLCEANMFLNGIYSKTINNRYGYVFYEPNGGSLTYRVQGFVCETNSAPIADAERNGDVFLGWYTDLTGGSRVTELNRAVTGSTLYARWQSSEHSEDQAIPSTVIRVTGDVVNVRKGPGTNYGISKQVYQDTVLIVSHVAQLSNRKWGKVQDGWICLDYTNYDALMNGTVNPNPESNGQSSNGVTTPNPDPEPNTPPTPPDTPTNNRDVVSGIVRVNDLLRIRSGPGTAYSTVGYLSSGHRVEILEQQTAGSMVWGRIARGWISMDYIVVDSLHTDNTAEPEPPQEPKPELPQETQPEPPQETEPEQETMDPVDQSQATTLEGKIIADALRIRARPGTDNPILGFYYQNDVVSISEKILVDSIFWGKTNRGWINMDYFLPVTASEESSPPNPNGVKTVIADCLRVRKEIGTNSRIAALLYYGDTVTVLETKTVDGMVWGRVDKGWICMDYVA